MEFYQYIMFAVSLFLVFITIYNIVKIFIILNKNKDSEVIKETEEMNENIKNLLISMILLSVTSLLFILIMFNK